MRAFESSPAIGAVRQVARSCVQGMFLLCVATPALAQCPSSTFRFPTVGSEQNVDAPTFAGTGEEGSWVRGDHRIGQFSLHHSGFLSPTVIVARDRYDVTGVAPGTPVNVKLRFHIDGWTYTDGCGGTGCCGMLVATARSFPDTAQATLIGHTFSGRQDFSGEVEVPVTLVAGTPRDLEVEMYGRRCAGGAHTTDATGRIIFEGLDQNAVVVSCKGFGPMPVPTQRRSWGEIKVIYR